MNFMKKIFSIKFQIIIGIVIVILLITMIIMLFVRSSDKYKYLINQQDYYIEKNDEYLNIDIYSNHIEDYYLNKEAIQYAKIKSLDNDFETYIDVRKVESTNTKILREDIYYYLYEIETKLPFEGIEYELIKDTSLILCYISGEELRFPLGNLIFYKENFGKDIHINHLKGIVNTINDVQMLVGIGVSLYTDDELTINKIVSLDNRCYFQNDNLLEVNDLEFDNNKEISNIVDFKYEINYKDNMNNDYLVLKEKNYKFVVPLSYHEIESINTLGFNIEYQKNGIKYVETIKPFKFFSNNHNDYKEVIYDPNTN